MMHVLRNTSQCAGAVDQSLVDLVDAQLGSVDLWELLRYYEGRIVLLEEAVASARSQADALYTDLDMAQATLRILEGVRNKRRTRDETVLHVLRNTSTLRSMSATEDGSQCAGAAESGGGPGESPGRTAPRN